MLGGSSGRGCRFGAVVKACIEFVDRGDAERGGGDVDGNQAPMLVCERRRKVWLRFKVGVGELGADHRRIFKPH